MKAGEMVATRWWRLLSEPRFAVLYCGLAGLLIPFWVLSTYAPADDLRAILIVLLILIGFVFGINELWRRTTELGLLHGEIEALDTGLGPEAQLGRMSAALQRLVQGRLHGKTVPPALGISYTPYLIGALILLGLIGTFIGLVDTLGGTRLALQTTSDLDGMRSSLLGPIAGLAQAFGTSVSGVATSVALGLAATLTRRQELSLHQVVTALASTSFAALDPLVRQTTALEALVEQGTAIPSVVGRFDTAVGALIRTLDAVQTTQGSLSHSIAHVIGERVDAIRGDLQTTIQRFSNELEPALKGVLIHASGLLDDAGKDLIGRVQQRFEASAQRNHEQRSEWMKVLESQRIARISEEVQHFEQLGEHARGLTAALQAHVEAISGQYSRHLEALEQHLRSFDERWRAEAEAHRKEQEARQRTLERQIQTVREDFTAESQVLATRHQALLEAINRHYQELTERYATQTAALADQAARQLSELSHKYDGFVAHHEEDREQLRKAWGVEQGRQQRQFDTLLQKMREDLDDRRRTDAEQISNLNGWAQQLVKRVEIGVVDRAASWDAQFSKLIGALAETADALRYGERARAKDLDELVQRVSEAERQRGEDFRRLVTTFRGGAEP